MGWVGVGRLIACPITFCQLKSLVRLTDDKLIFSIFMASFIGLEYLFMANNYKIISSKDPKIE